MKNSKNSTRNSNEKLTKQFEYYKQKPNHLCNSCIKSSKCVRRIQWGLVFGEIRDCIEYKKNNFSL